MPAQDKTPKKYGFGKVKDTMDLTLPSHEDPDDENSPHNVCRVRRPGVQGLIAAGVLDSFDSLTGLVQSEHLDRVDGKNDRKKDTKEEMALLKDQKENIMKALALVDKVVLYCVVEPKLLPVSDGERDDEKLYVDDVDLDDRMFILQFALGGSSDLETFRKGTAESVASVAAL